MPKEKNQLHSVELDEISVVDNGANVLAKVVLMKRADQENDVDKAAPAGIQFNLGFADEGSEVQSVIFDSKLWDAERAKKWLKDHNMVSEKLDETTNTLRFRQKDPADFKRFRVITPGKAVSKALKAKDSFQRVSSVVEQAVRDEFFPKTKDGMEMPLWIRDLYKDSAVFDQDGQTYRVDYSVDRDENSGELKVTLGDKVPVEVVYQDVKKSDEPPVIDDMPDIPDELKHRVLKMRMDVLSAKLRKSNSCRVPSGPAGGQYCEGGGKGSGGGTGGGGALSAKEKEAFNGVRHDLTAVSRKLEGVDDKQVEGSLTVVRHDLTAVSRRLSGLPTETSPGKQLAQKLEADVDGLRHKIFRVEGTPDGKGSTGRQFAKEIETAVDSLRGELFRVV